MAVLAMLIWSMPILAMAALSMHCMTGCMSSIRYITVQCISTSQVNANTHNTHFITHIHQHTTHLPLPNQNVIRPFNH